MTERDLAYYGEYSNLLLAKEKWLVIRLEEILNQVSTDPENKPAEHLLSRIKNSDSLQQKMIKQEEATDVDHAFEVLSDIIGVRIVVHFIGDVYKILKKIENSDQWEMVNVKDYIRSPKKNGYRSLHVILAIPFSWRKGESIKVEIQIRTIAMDCWASLEHQLRYKKNIKDAELIGMELGRCAAEMASTDLTMQTIRQMIEKG